MCKDFVFVFYFSYKLWYNYLKLRRRQVKGRCLNDPAIEDVINAHERALVFMHKVIVDSKEKQKQNQYNSEILYLSPVCFIQMPRIWIDYCQFLVDYSRITKTRRTFDRALRALPITQHHRIWPRYLKFVRLYDLPETAIRVYRRHLKVVLNELFCLLRCKKFNINFFKQ